MPNFDKDILIKNIKQLMKDNNITQPKLAEELNVGQPSISKCLSGKQSISIELVYQIAHHFDVSIDDLCSDHTLEEDTTTQEKTVPKPDSPAQILTTVCTSLATLFKTSTLRTNEFERRESVYIEETDEYGNELGHFYPKRDQFNMDPVNKYISIYFPNYENIQTSFESQADADEYFCLLHEYGNSLDINIRINKFLKLLTDLQKVYLENNMTVESYCNAIDDNLAKLVQTWDRP